uniref:CSC1-like protein 1 n=1 Tax=Gouania willdenowi TaxID=441366 RepID=A0A8C5HTE6_GOUWI
YLLFELATMSSQWEEQWPLVAKNITPFPNSSCFDPKHSTVLTGLDFGGVPVVLLINFCIFVFLLILFSCIRKKVWDYGRLALVADNTGCWSWLLYIFRLDDDEIKAKCGMDAVHYLSFQRHLIFLLVIVTIASLAVILPVNMTGDLYKNDLPFGQTTIANLQDGDNLLWLHSVFAVLYLILTVVVLRHHTSKIKGMRRETVRLTVLAECSFCGNILEAYPNCTVCDVTLVVKPKYCCCALYLYAKSSHSTFSFLFFCCLRANLSVPDISWYVRYVAINIFILLLLTFLTTPTIIINTMDKFNVTKPIEYLHSPIISQFFPTLLLWSFSALLPTIVYYSTLGEGHWNRSREQLSMMRKLYFFLLFMVLILPSLGLTSLAVFFRWLFDKEFLNGGKLRFECVFLPDQGAFFVNYVITAALVGSGMELLRLPGLLIYTIRMMCARSAAERKYVKKNQAFEFEYGVTYGWSLCVFTVIMAYSIICPIITPFGLLYMLLKHLVDRYNLVFTFLSARLDRQVHLWAVNQALAAPIICLIWLYFFSVLRTGFWAPTSLFTLVVLCLTVFICLSYTFLNQFKYLSPLNYEVSLCIKTTKKTTSNGVQILCYCT